jgi:glycosyltransferase involved in cell wall biosynthesis
MKIVVIANSAWYLANFRLSLMQVLCEQGHQVLALSPHDRHVPRIEAAGVRHVHWPLEASSRNPWGEWRAIRRLRRLLHAENADVAFSYTPKGNIYTGLALRGTRTRFVPNVSGLGVAFTKGSALGWLVKRLYARAFAGAQRVFFQNDVDRTLFVGAGLVADGLTERLPGSGVDLERFRPVPLPLGPQRVLLLVGRMLVAKGVPDLVEATRRVKAQRSDLRVCLLGPVDAGRAGAVGRDELERWQAEGLIEYLGETDDVRPLLAQADAAVLPSVYREGVPRSLLEAAAMGRPAITYDMPGCRDAVVHGRTGWLCPPGDVEALTRAMIDMLELRADALRRLGEAARAHVESHFSEALVLDRYTEVLASGANQAPAAHP